MRTESYQLPGETIEQFRERQRKLRQRRDDETRTSSLADSSSTPFNSFDSSFSSVFDSGSPSDSSTSDSFSGGGGDFGGGGASSDY